MLNRFKRSLITLSLAGIYASSSIASVSIDSSKANTEGDGIQGYIPYMESIGTRIVSNATEDGQIQVGTVLEVPTYINTNNVSDKLAKLFVQKDFDGDVRPKKGIDDDSNLRNVDTSKNFRIEWYVIEAKDWDKVRSWDDLDSTTLIPSEIGTDNPDNQNSATLVVPEIAANKRIGFIAYPETEYGTPDKGQPVKAWDISKLWTQKAPTNSGECLVETGCTDYGTPLIDNPGGGGGDVVAPPYIIRIYDAQKPNRPLVDGSDLYVNRDYFATIKIFRGDEYYELSEMDAKNSLKWHLVLEDSNTNELNSVAYDWDSGRLGIASDKYGPDQLTKFTFKTQENNSEADERLKNLPPNYSEQGKGLYISFDIGE